MRDITIHCVHCKRLNSMPAERLTHSHVVRCDHCSALRALTDREKAMLLDAPRLVVVTEEVSGQFELPHPMRSIFSRRVRQQV